MIKINYIVLALLVSNSIWAPKRKLAETEWEEIEYSTAKKQKLAPVERSEEEKAFIMSINKLNSNIKNLSSIKALLKEILSEANNKFYNKIVDIIYTINQATISPKQVTRGVISPHLWRNITPRRISEIKIGEDLYTLQADNNFQNPGKEINLLKNGERIGILEAQEKVYRVLFSPSGNYAISIGWKDSENSILELWDLTSKSSWQAKNPMADIEIKAQVKKITPVVSIKNWVDGAEISFVKFDDKEEFIIIGTQKWDIRPYTKLRKKLHNEFEKLYGKTTPRKDIDDKEYYEETGIIKYQLINNIIDRHDVKKLPPFKITYPRLKAIFKELPIEIQKAFIDLGYVEIK